MSESQQEVKKEIIKHACRNIEIIYEPGKTIMTEEDEQLVEGLIRLHDFELKVQNFVDEMYKFSVPVNKGVEEMRKQLEDVVAVYKKCAEMADNLSGTTYLVEEASLEKLTESQLHTTELLQSHHKDMLKLYGDVKILEKKVNDFIVMDEEEMTALYDEYSDIATRQINNYEINSINIVCYDDEYERFLSYRDGLADRRKMLSDLCDAALENYTKLNLENTAIYNVWEEFTKRCNLLRTVAGLHGAIIGSNFN